MIRPPPAADGSAAPIEPRFGALAGSPLAAAAAGIDTCVHCGFCLQACPTYLVLEDENDGPRGRIVLMRSLLEGTLTPGDEPVQTHIARCLGCRGCETVCPSGVPYGHLLEATRATLRAAESPPLAARLVLAVFARPRLLALMLGAARVARATGLSRLLARLPGRIGFAIAMLEATRPTVASRPGDAMRAAPRSGAGGAGGAGGASGASGAVAVLDGCVMKGLFGHVNAATARAVERAGFVLAAAPGQRCCGALHAHAGDLDTARALARVNIAAFERSGADRIAVNSAGCGAMMKEYGHLLADDPEWHGRAAALAAKVRDISEIVAAAAIPRAPAPPDPAPLRATYSPPCHLLHAQRLAAPPLAMIAAIPGLELVPLPDADQCCGAAGIYNLIEPETSARVLASKLTRIASTGASIVLTGNPGCLMQIGAGLARTGSAARAMHPVELLER